MDSNNLSLDLINPTDVRRRLARVSSGHNVRPSLFSHLPNQEQALDNGVYRIARRTGLYEREESARPDARAELRGG